MKTIVCITSALVTILAAPAHAGATLTADGAAIMALKGNPGLTAARTILREAEIRHSATGRLANPELELEVAGGQDFEGRVSAGIVQRFPITSRLRLEREVSEIQVEMARLEVRDRERQIASAARRAFYEVVAARAAMELTKQQTSTAAAFSKSIANGAAEGLASPLDARQAELATETLRVAEESLGIPEVEARSRLCTILGVPTDSHLDFPSTLALPKVPPPTRRPGNRPDLELAELSLRAGRTDVSLAKASKWDDVGVGVFVEGERFRDEPQGIEPEALVGVRFSVPLPFWQDGSAKVAEKQAATEGKAAAAASLRLAVENEVATTHMVMSSRFRTADQILTTLVPMAQKEVDDTEAAFQRAEVTIQALLGARARLAEVRAAAIEACKDYHLSHAEWLEALGDIPTNP